MTIEEAIKHAEEVAEEQEELYRLCPASESMFYCDGTKDCKTLKNGKNKGCQKCAEEHRQLAEWLKDYKRLKEQEHCDDAVSRQAVLDINERHHGQMPNHVNHEIWKEIKALQSVTLQPCDDAISRQEVLDEIDKRFDLAKPFKQLIKSMPPVTPQQNPNIKALGEDIRICQKSITDKKVLIGFNMAVALCNKYLAESEEKGCR